MLGLQVIALFCRARVQFTRRQVDEALEAAREAYQRLEDGPVEEWDEQIRLVLAEALIAKGHDEEANQILQTAFDIVSERYRKIAQPEYRASYVGRNEEVRQLLELAHRRLSLTLAP